MSLPQHIPLRGAYVGLTRLPWIALAHSDLAPLLILHVDAVETRVLRRCRRPYAAVSGFMVPDAPVRPRVVLAFHGSAFTFGGWLRDPADGERIARVLRERGCTGMRASGIPAR